MEIGIWQKYLQTGMEGGQMKNILIVKLFRKASLSVSLCSCCEGVEALVRCPAPTDAADIY